jgi:hypothetical protein
MIAPTPSIRLIYHFPNLFPEILDLQERVPKTSAGSWFQSWMVLFTTDDFLIDSVTKHLLVEIRTIYH